MEGILFSEKISEMIPFDLTAGIVYFPVRHHSPGCSYHLLKVLEMYRPDCVLVEGPQTADKLIPVLTDSGTVPPVAFYYYYKDTAKHVSEEGQDYKCYYPFLRTSPEYNALCYARDNGADCGFIDLPYGDILINTAENKGLRKTSEITAYADEHHLSENRYFAALCEKTGMRSFEEFWENYFEIDALRITTEEYVRRLYTHCIICRMNTDEQYLLSDGTLARESFMAENIRRAAADHDRVLVVTGGFHSYGLYQLIQGFASPQKVRLHKFSEKVQDVYAMRYSFEAADALSGYSAGMQDPGFYDKVWKGISEGLETEKVYENAVLSTLLDCARECAEKKLSVTMSDISSAVSMYQGLAALRGKSQAGLYELYDSVGSCFIKGEKNRASDLPVRLLGKVCAGEALGQLCNSAEKVPIIKDFEELSKKYKLKIGSVIKQKTELEVFAKPTHREISRLFYRMGFLDCSFAKRIKGADLINNSDRSRVREIWEYKRVPDTDASLIDNSVYGGTIEEACAVLSLRRLHDVQKTNEGAKLYVECFLMGLDVTAGFADRMEDIIISDGDFFSLGQGLYYFNMLRSLYRLYQNDDRCADGFLRTCLYKTVSMLPNMINVTEDRADECIKTCRLLYSLVKDDLLSDCTEMLKEAFEAMVQKDSPEPAVYGAVLGLLYGMDSGCKDDIRAAVNGYLTGSKEMQKRGATFLRGLFCTARDIVLVGNEFISITGTLLSGLDMMDFLDVLPELRLAFSYFTPSEIDSIARTAAAIYGGDAARLRLDMEIDKEQYSTGVDLERKIIKEMGWADA